MSNFKKLAIITLVLSLLISATVSANIRVKKIGITNQQAAVFLLDKGLLQGDNGNLMLEKELTREQMMVIMSRLLGAEKEAEKFPLDNMTFQDVTNEYYAHFVAWAQANKITSGHSPEAFGFGERLTGWQTQAFFVRVLGFKDVSDEKIKAKADELGITDSSPYKDAALDTQSMLRGDMSILMYNALYAKTSKSVMLGEQMGLFPKQ